MKTLSLTEAPVLQGIQVSGAGEEGADGFYYVVDDLLGARAFARDDRWQVSLLFTPADTWALANASGAPVYEAPYAKSVPPEMGWMAVIGSGPAPTLEFVYEDPAVDIHLDAKGNLALATTAEGLRQKLQTRLQLFRGEMFLDRAAGVPYLQRILGRAQPSADLEGSVAQILDVEVLKEPEVLSITTSEATFDSMGRTFLYSAELDTIHGSINLEEPING